MGLVAEAIVQAIRAGAPVYNQGDVGGCYRLYRDCATMLVDTNECLAEEATALR